MPELADASVFYDTRRRGEIKAKTGEKRGVQRQYYYRYVISANTPVKAADAKKRLEKENQPAIHARFFP